MGQAEIKKMDNGLSRHLNDIGIQCVVAAGGSGTRLRLLTEEIPKPMVPILGMPFLYWLITRIIRQGIRQFVILTGYHAERIVSYFGDGAGLGCSIVYSTSDHPLGSGGALWAAREILEEEFLFINGDDYPEINYAELIGDFRQRGALAMVAVCKDPRGQLAIDEETGFVRQYLPSACLPYLDCGTKAFRKSVLDLIDIEPPFTLEPEFWPLLIAKQQLVAFQLESRPHAIDTVDGIRAFEGWLKQQRSKPGDGL